MPTVQEGDILLLSREAVIRHFDSNLNFIQIKSIRTFEEQSDRDNGITNDDGANMLIQAGNEIFVAMPGHQCVGILDLELTRVDTFLNPFRGDIELGDGSVVSIAYGNNVLYICTRDDYDLFGTGDRVAIAAYSWPSRELLWRRSPAYQESVITVPGNQAFFATTTWIKLSGSTLYIVDRGYGVGYLDITTQEFTPLHYLDAVHPTYFNDSINQSDPPGFFPDVTQLHYYPDMPHNFLVLTDGTEGPASEDIPVTEGNKINTIAFYRYFNGNTSQPDTSDAQLQVRATSIDVDNNGKIYVQVNQLGSTQSRQISNYPGAPNFWGILSQQYSPEHYIVVLNSNGTFDRRILLPIHSSEEADVNHYRSGYLFGHSSSYGNNAPHGVSVARDGSYAYSVQIGTVNDIFNPNFKGAGPFNKVNLATDEVTYYGDVELVPRWAIEELNDGIFRESNNPTYRHVLSVTFIAPPVVDFFFPFVTLIGAT